MHRRDERRVPFMSRYLRESQTQCSSHEDKLIGSSVQPPLDAGTGDAKTMLVV